MTDDLRSLEATTARPIYHRALTLLAKMSLSEIIALLILLALVWLWFGSLSAREAGIRAVRLACQADSLQLLDETIAIRSVKLARNDEGRMVLLRIYEFEYSDTGDNRRRGTVHLLGSRVTLLDVGVLLVPDANQAAH